MYLVINAEGKYWDGFAWSQKGKEFLSIPAAVRSLHEEGEDDKEVTIMDKESLP
jgi:hypothetical protein